MRQIGTLEKQSSADRLAAYLVTQGISAHAEADGAEWAIWVRDENRLEEARDAFRDFKHNPDDSRYKDVERTASQLQREEAAQREAARKHLVEMRGKWGKGGVAKRAPLVFVLVGACVMVSLWTKSMNGRATPEQQKLLFASADSYAKANPDDPARAFVDIRKGEVWRLITPIFMHGGIWHLVMNIYWVYYLGSQIEHFEGTWKLGLLVITAAVLSNTVQAISQGPNFLGISGVGVAFFGYVWIKTKYDPSSRMFISNVTIVIFIAYLFYCLFQEGIANEAHFAGLGVGVIMAYLPLLLRPTGKN
ncbi:MAG: rhomboid family intramembrane serine protease [Planctomycetaceae bacterium]|nr:rhomboid family intramembrane serine protease [Planctomycetales bacterium]MCB9926754.1 rhomboid family intramembrane serine protease [Planctomycetaceae bacterium]